MRENVLLNIWFKEKGIPDKPGRPGMQKPDLAGGAGKKVSEELGEPMGWKGTCLPVSR